MELNPELDLVINAADLNLEFRKFSVLFYRYYCEKANAEKQRDISKAKLKEMKALVYKTIKNNPTIKHTEKSLEAEIDMDPMVVEMHSKFIEAEHNVSTITGAVESMRAKKDMLMQLGADARKEK